MSEKIYLPGLNGLRALAACSVILAHVGENFVQNGLFQSSYFGTFGGYAVTVFFALSGFLITYLLLKEIEKKSKIDVKKFYVRRILRIWPLYFFYIFLVLLVMNFKVSKSILYYLFIIPNVPFALQLATGKMVAIPLLIHYWSLGVEEQFYLFWPLLIKFSKKIKTTLIVFCLGYFGLKVGMFLIHAPIEFQALLLHTRFSCLAIGGIAAYMYFEKNKYLYLLTNIYAELAAWLVLILFFVDKLRVFSIINNEIVSVATVVIILNQISGKSAISLENKVLDYLGKISFGLYIYNPLIIFGMSYWFSAINLGNPYLNGLVLFLIYFSAIVFISHISYNYFEKRFLKFKKNYTTVQSAASKAELHE